MHQAYIFFNSVATPEHWFLAYRWLEQKQNLNHREEGTTDRALSLQHRVQLEQEKKINFIPSHPRVSPTPVVSNF